MASLSCTEPSTKIEVSGGNWLPSKQYYAGSKSKVENMDNNLLRLGAPRDAQRCPKPAPVMIRQLRLALKLKASQATNACDLNLEPTMGFSAGQLSTEFKREISVLLRLLETWALAVGHVA